MLDDHLTLGERVRIIRNRRRLSQKATAELCGRSVSWLKKIEAGSELDRWSLICRLAQVLMVSPVDLVGARLLDWKDKTERGSVPELCNALYDPTQHVPLPTTASDSDVDLDRLNERLSDAWSDYQNSRYNRLTQQLPAVVRDARFATRVLGGDGQRRAYRIAASALQLSGVYLPKLGDPGSGLYAAQTGLDYAQSADDTVSLAALYRIVAYATAARGQHGEAMSLCDYAITALGPSLGAKDADGLSLSVLGMLHLVGSRAAAQHEDRQQSTAHLRAAAALAKRLGGDANYGWTGFGPTNVVIHRTTCLVELGDVERAVVIGPPLDTSALPVERQGRHAIESARALAAVGRMGDAVKLLLKAEPNAPEQVRHHQASRGLVRRALRSHIGSDQEVTALATRMGLAEL